MQPQEQPPANQTLSEAELQAQRAMHEQQQQQIRQEIMAESALISQPLPLLMMLDEFVNNEGFYSKVQGLLKLYNHYRKTRRDGSCFYRALTFSIFEGIYLRKDLPLKEKMLKKLKDAKQFLLKAKFEGLIFEDIQSLFLEKLDDWRIKRVEDIVELFCNPDVSNYLIAMMRFLTAGEIKNNPFLYETFIDNGMPAEMYCQLQIEPMDKEADQISIMALLNYLQVGIKIIYLDSNVKAKEAYTVVLPECTKPECITATLLYRPGHYDILYS